MGMGETTRSVTVLALGSAAALLGWSERAIDVGEGATLAELVRRLEQSAPQLADVRSRVRFAVNQRYAADDSPLRPGDEVAIIPPVSGG